MMTHAGNIFLISLVTCCLSIYLKGLSEEVEIEYITDYIENSVRRKKLPL
jgi:hypothetical protein